MERRDCVEVINEMLKQIPKEEVEFIKDLEWNKEDASYKAPEDNIQWERTMQTLQKHIVKPIYHWQWMVLNIFTTKSITELQILFQE